MLRRSTTLPSILVVIALASSQLFAQTEKKSAPAGKPAIIWEDPGDIKSKNLFYGPGSKQDAPHGTFKFGKEDDHAHSPTLDAEDQSGKKSRATPRAEER